MNIAAYIDHTLLRQDLSLADVKQLCDEAIEARFAAVCIPPIYVREAAQRLSGSGVATVTVLGFPFGYHLPSVKAMEAELAIIGGADELDMVANISAIRNGDWKALELEVREVLEVAKLSGRKLKVIIESGILNEEELIKCCELYGRFNIDFLKTSTGFAAVGARVEDVRTMRALLPSHISIKASGGIRSYAQALELIDAGASRIGCSASVQILKEAQSRP